MRTAAIVLAGGSGSRMNSSVKKQYLMLKEKPLLWYSLQVFQACPRIDEIVLVCGAGEEEFCREEFVQKYKITKISQITEGGSERCHSVYAGLKAAGGCDYVLIHDGARPFIDEAMLDRIFDALADCDACITGMPVKDTIKLQDGNGYVADTLPREKLWTIQTPQSFSYPLILTAYEKMEQEDLPAGLITDDAMVLERYSDTKIQLIEGSYDNIKITTPEDLLLAEMIVDKCPKIRKIG